jgi:hypothetical protein
MSYESEPYEYALHLCGSCFDNPGFIGEGITKGKHFFSDVRELWYFFAEVKILQYKHKAGFLKYSVSEGRDVRFFTRGKIILMHDFITYQVSYDFDTIVDHGVAAAAFKLGLLSCDCGKSALIRKFNPEFQLVPCGQVIELINVKFENLKNEKQPYENRNK